MSNNSQSTPNPNRYDDETAKGPVILSRHIERQTTAVDLGIIWYASDAARLCAILNACGVGSGIEFHFRPLYANAQKAESES